jgi:SSS family solute:Na+ symporter
VHSKESVPIGLCKFIFGVPTLAGASKWQYMDPQMIALPIAAVVFIIVNGFTKPVDEAHVNKCFEGIK